MTQIFFLRNNVHKKPFGSPLSVYVYGRADETRTEYSTTRVYGFGFIQGKVIIHSLSGLSVFRLYFQKNIIQSRLSPTQWGLASIGGPRYEIEYWIAYWPAVPYNGACLGQS